MKVFVFSIGEHTTDLAVELMEKYGFDVQLVYNETSSLWEKLHYFYTKALETGDEFVMRMDADIIPNKNVIRLSKCREMWTCASGFDWYKQDRGAISIHVMHRDTIKKCLEHIGEAKRESRPETYLWRLAEVNRFTRIEEKYSCGIHGYAQENHRKRIKELKHIRNQDYDWELLERIEAL